MKVKQLKLAIALGVLTVICITGWLTARRYGTAHVCHEPGLAKCLYPSQWTIDTTVYQKKVLFGYVVKVFGVPIYWGIIVEDVGDDFFVAVEELKFTWLREKRNSSQFGSIEARWKNLWGRKVLEAKLEKPPMTQWILMED